MWRMSRRGDAMEEGVIYDEGRAVRIAFSCLILRDDY